jgi:TonB family protein
VIDNRYEVLHRIPGGGMGELYKVRHLHLHDVRAIKILRSDQTGDRNYRERFLREARIAASIKHPNVALLHDFATLPDKSFYMVEEFIDGATLARSLREGRRFSLNEIVDMAQQVLLGLGAIHDKGIIHRDISPDNIMLADSADGGIRVKIIDLGIARSIDPSDAHSLTSAGLFIGKPHYASPEQMRLLEDDAPIDHRTDLYSLGVVLYEVVSGKVPFEASTPFEYLMKQLSGDLAAVDRSVADLVPPDLEKFIVKLLRANRQERFQSTVEALLALSKIRVGQATIQDVPVDSADAAYPVSPPTKKRRQTAEVPIEQLRKLIEQDRPDGVHEPVITSPPDQEPDVPPTQVEEMDDSQKITVMQTAAVPIAGEPGVADDETERTPLPARDDEDSEPVAFVPEPVESGVPRQDDSIADEHDTPVEPATRTRVARPSSGSNPMVWFAAGIIFVAVVSIGGYLLYRWLDSRFGQTPIRDTTPVASEPVTSTIAVDDEVVPTSTTEDTATATETAGARPATEVGRQSDVTEVEPPPVAPKPAAPQSSKPAPARPAPATSTSTKEPPSPARTSESEVESEDEQAVTPSTPAEAGNVEEPSAGPEAASPANAPVVLPGSTDDVREGDLVAPGPGVVGPEVTKAVEPIYPPLSSNMGSEGIAMFSVLVGPEGKVEVLKLIVSTGSEPLDESAEDAAWQTEFRPATKNGIKVRMWKTLRFQFKKTRGF